jgi:hypothetical protein
MTPFKTEIETQVRNLLKTDAQFSSIVGFSRGILYLVPIEWFPLAEIFVDTQAEDTEQQGKGGATAVHYWKYGGVIFFTDQYPDHPVLINREIDIVSQDCVAVWVEAAAQLLRDDQTLTNLVSADGKQQVWRVDVDVPQYAIVQRPPRVDNLESQAVVAFTVYAEEQTW